MLWAAVADCSPLFHNSIIFIHLFLFCLLLLLFHLVLYKAVLMFLLLQHSGLDLCRSRVEKAPWKELSNLWLVHFSLVVLYVMLDKTTLQ